MFHLYKDVCIILCFDWSVLFTADSVREYFFCDPVFVFNSGEK